MVLFNSCSKDMVNHPNSNQALRTKQLTSGPLNISSISPTSAIPYTSITITGSGFDTVKANNLVKVNGVIASVTSATSTQIVFTVTAGSSSGPLTVSTNGSTASYPDNFKVLKYKATAVVNQSLNRPVQSLAFDRNGTIYGVDGYAGGLTDHPTVFKYKQGARTVLYISPDNSRTIDSNGYHNNYTYTMPAGLVTDSHGNIYVALVLLHGRYLGFPPIATITTTILKITPDGKTTKLADSVNGQPIGGQLVGKMCIDANDNIYFIDDGSSISVLGNSIIYKVTPAGVTSAYFSAPGQLGGGIAVDESGNAYVSVGSSAGTSVEKITPQGNTSIIAGPYNTPPFYSIFFDPTNNLIAAYGDNVLIINKAGRANYLTLSHAGSDLYIDYQGNIYANNVAGSLAIYKYSLQ